MPFRPPRACGRCGKAFRGAHCPCSQRASDARRGTRTERGYGQRWNESRLPFLRKYPLCGNRPGDQPPVMSRCWETGRIEAATVVDHVKPHRGDQKLFWDVQGNWQSLCDDCHRRKTAAGQ